MGRPPLRKKGAFSAAERAPAEETQETRQGKTRGRVHSQANRELSEAREVERLRLDSAGLPALPPRESRHSGIAALGPTASARLFDDGM